MKSNHCLGKIVKYNSDYLLVRILGAVMLVIILAIAQDFLEAQFFDQGFYWSEVILFNLKWFFLALGLAAAHRFGRHPWYVFVTISILMAGILICLNAAAIFFLSGQLLDFQFGFWFLVKDGLSSNTLTSLLGCSLIYAWRRQPAAIGQNRMTDEPARKMQIRHRGEILFLKPDDILFITREKGLTVLYTRMGKIHHDEPLHVFATFSNKIVQIHRSTLVNLSYVEKCISRGNGDYDVVLRSDHVIRLSRRYRKNFLHST